MASHIDPKLAEKILHEVKSQGVFDEFRKDSISDVDTKPAYQNLRQRVENAVQKFLSEQRWTPETNKHQLRERLRRHIVESGFLDVGVERIVDQVVNPKIGSVFQPRIEEIAFKFLGISPPLPTKREPPPLPPMPPLPPFPPMNCSPLKVDTNPTMNLLPTDLEQVSPESDKVKEEDLNDSGTLEDKMDDDDESPPFEPLTECKSPKSEIILKSEIVEKINVDCEPKMEIVEKVENIKVECIKNEESNTAKEKSPSNDALASQESQLSQVSSDSRISSVSNQLLRNGNDCGISAMENTNVNISEEAQMPKFNENSTETEESAKNSKLELHFDIKKDEIKFEGTERKINILDGEITEFSKVAPIIKDAYVSDSIEMKGSFHFTKLNVEVEPCNSTREAGSTVSSQDDTSSAQLCIVERPENELQGETNSVQKCSQEDSSTNTNPTTQITDTKLKENNERKNERNGKHYSSSSSSSSRLKKASSTNKKHSKEKSSRQNDEKEQRHKSKCHERDRERDRERNRDRYDGKHSSKTSSSSNKRHESTDKHRSSSKRSSEKEQHVSSSSRSESRSRHKSSKRDHRDKYDKKKSHKSSSSSKDQHRSEERKTRTDDHNESREKIRWRKSTDSNDEDKNPNNHAPTNSTIQQTKKTNETESNLNGNSKIYTNNSSKNAKDTQKYDALESTRPAYENDKVENSSRVVYLNDVLENPSTNFVELETKSAVQIHMRRQHSPTVSSDTNDDTDLLYFEQITDQLQNRLDLLNDAIDKCRNVIKIVSPINERMRNDDKVENENSDDELSTSKDSVCQANVDELRTGNDIVTEAKATLLVGCYRYSDCSDKNSIENNGETSPKRLKLNTEYVNDINMKENQIMEKNSIITDEQSKKPTLSKRIGTLAKQSQQQRYSSEDLYKPRPILSQRSKRRGLDTVI